MNQPDIEELLKGLPPEAAAEVRKNVPLMQRSLFSTMANKLSGKVKYATQKFTTIADLVEWLNEHRSTVNVVAVLPDFQSYQYHLVYEEQASD